MRLKHGAAVVVDDAIIAGMLHDIGKLILADHLTAQLQQARARAIERGVALHEAEQEVLGATHALVGAYLLGL